jgi:hypothetical protein
MKRWLALPSVQIAIAVAVFLVLGYRGGPFVMVMTSPLLAMAIARPLLTLLANFRHGVRERTWLPVHGHHYVFKGITIHVQEDVDRCRWIPLADVAKVVGRTASERVLCATFPGRCQRMEGGSELYLRDDALVQHLGRERNPVALRFRTWIDREVGFPGRRIRRGLGITPEPPDEDGRATEAAPLS